MNRRNYNCIQISTYVQAVRADETARIYRKLAERANWLTAQTVQRDAEAEAEKARIEEDRKATLKRWRKELPSNVQFLEARR